MYAAISLSEPQTFQRADGAVRIGFAPGGLGELYQRAPCRVLLPRVAGAPEAVLINTAGGLTGGDRIDQRIDVAAGASALLTTQAAEKIYRSLGPDVRIATHLRVAGQLDWLPQETILFDGARLDRALDIDVAGDGRLLALDWLVLGRAARGERFTYGAVRDCWTLRRDGRLLWVDRFRLAGDVAALAARRSLLDGAVALATLVYMAADAPARLEELRALLAGLAVRAGVSLRAGVLVCRFLARDGFALRRDVSAVLTAFRGRPLPRVWAC
jgi:urease accessory protein